MFIKNYLKGIKRPKQLIGNFLLNIIFVASIIIIVNGCSTTHQIVSKWKSDDLVVDGDYSDWQNRLEYIEDEDASVGFQNDKDYLYLCLIVNEPFKAMQMLRAGFIVWFIPDDESKIIGLKFPLGISNIGFDRKERRNFEKNDERGNLEKIIERLFEKEKDFEIVDKSKYPLWMYPLENNKGIKIKISEKSNKLVYELQIPISKQQENNFYVPVTAGENLKITFETLELEFPSDKRENMGNIPQGGFQRPAGGMRRNMPAFTKIEPLNFSVRVTLVKSDY
ncbi:MAG: hypothetical protein QHH13_08585 [Melioribacter sp.]|uniref:hypothetical protein n=1 Tax=Rosettibacter primus TaxID=3111523 RepID=UPI00247BE824|nr:hypothetical protein [Melioribacter sp.]